MKYFIMLFLPVIFFTSCIKDRTAPAAPPVIVSTGDTVMFYWSFNTFDSSNRSADFSVNKGATFSYFAAYIDSTGGTLVDALPGIDSGACLRVRNPSDSVIFYMPTTGYDSVVFEFAEEASSTTSGSTSNDIYYTTDGVHYISTALVNNNYTVGTIFQSYSFDFSADPNTSNNPKFAVAIVFANNNTGTSGNDRFDNVTLLGVRK